MLVFACLLLSGCFGLILMGITTHRKCPWSASQLCGALVVIICLQQGSLGHLGRPSSTLISQNTTQEASQHILLARCEQIACPYNYPKVPITGA